MCSSSQEHEPCSNVHRYEPEGRALLFERGVSDYDLAVATVLLNFGRSEITRRSRLTDQAIAEASMHVSTKPPNMTHAVRELEDLADRRERNRNAVAYESDVEDETVSETSVASTAIVIRPVQTKKEPLTDTRLVLASKRKRNAIAVPLQQYMLSTGLRRFRATKFTSFSC